MKLLRILAAGTALTSSAAFAVLDSGHPTPSEERPSGKVLQEPQSRENPWFSQGAQNPWSSMAEREGLPSVTEPSETTEPNSTVTEFGAPPNESPALASPQPFDTERSPDPTATDRYSPPMGLGTDTYRS